MPSIAYGFYYRIAACVGAFLILLIVLLNFPPEHQWPSIPAFSNQPIYRRHSIPNQVHYVYLLSDPAADFNFKFSDFISVYSTSYHWKPDTIYLHTDASPDSIARAQGKGYTEKSKWTRLIFSQPNFKINLVTAPTHTTGTNRTIHTLEAKSDFVRVAAVHEFGGFYLDFDAHPLRPITPLLQSGFAAIASLQINGQMQCGTFMAVRHSLLTKLWAENQHIVYDGHWATHATKLLADIAFRLVAFPGEMLILEQDAFAPDSWRKEDVERMYTPHIDYPAAPLDANYRRGNTSSLPGGATTDQQTPKPFDDDTSSLTDRLYHPERFAKWTRDYSRSYIIHAFSPKRGGYKIEGFEEITPRYVLARQSNLARAVYPAVKDAWDRGLFGVDDL